MNDEMNGSDYDYISDDKQAYYLEYESPLLLDSRGFKIWDVGRYNESDEVDETEREFKESEAKVKFKEIWLKQQEELSVLTEVQKRRLVLSLLGTSYAAIAFKESQQTGQPEVNKKQIFKSVKQALEKLGWQHYTREQLIIQHSIYHLGLRDFEQG
ncbi:hypothetical protein ACFLXY_06750 [Chloroflexota bacterium]